MLLLMQDVKCLPAEHLLERRNNTYEEETKHIGSHRARQPNETGRQNAIHAATESGILGSFGPADDGGGVNFDEVNPEN